MKNREAREDQSTRKKQQNKKQKKNELLDIPTYEQRRMEETSKRGAQSAMQIQPQRIEIFDGSDNEYDVADLQKDSKNKDRMSEVISQLLLKNKISVKNAFDVPLISLDELSDFHKLGKGDNAWRKISSTLEADSKIFGYRVDSVHNDTYKVMQGLGRNISATDESEKFNKTKNNSFQLSSILESADMEFATGKSGVYTLDHHNINVDNLQYQFDFNPFFQRTKRAFDEGGAKGLLLNSLLTNSQMRLMIDTEDKISQRTMNSRESVGWPEIGNLVATESKPLGVMSYLSKMKISSDSYSRKLIGIGFLNDESVENPEVCFTIDEQFSKKEALALEVEGALETVQDHNQMEIEKVQGIEVSNNEIQTIQPIVSSTNKNQQKLKKKIESIGRGPETYEQFAEDAKKWMDEKDKAMTKMPIQTSVQALKSQHLRVDRLFASYILFNQLESFNRFDSIANMNFLNMKPYEREQYDDYNLLPISCQQHIDFNKKLVSRSLQQPNQPQEDIDQFLPPETLEEVKANESKKNQATIKQIKQELKVVLTNLKNDAASSSPSFVSSYKQLKKRDGQAAEVSIQTCFVTFLHLANENNLCFKILGSEDFIISK